MKRWEAWSVAAVIGLISAAGLAAVSWPENNEGWRALAHKGRPYVDPPRQAGTNPLLEADANRPDLDIVGAEAPATPSGFWAASSTHLMFRMRLRSSGEGAVGVHQFLLDLNDDNRIDWSLQLDQQTHNRVELVRATNGGPNFRAGQPEETVQLDPAKDDTAIWIGPATEFSRWSPADSNVGGQPGQNDWYLDVAIPWADYYAQTGTKSGDTLRLALTTSDSDLAVTQDVPAFAVAEGRSDPVPEPATLALLALGGLMILSVPRRP